MEEKNITYTLDFYDQAKKDIKALKKSEISAYNKLIKLLDELLYHPITGTGHPEPLSGDRVGQWSRRITTKHRLVYQIEEKNVIVLILSAYGHYDDK